MGASINVCLLIYGLLIVRLEMSVLSMSVRLLRKYCIVLEEKFSTLVSGPWERSTCGCLRFERMNYALAAEKVEEEATSFKIP